MKTLEAFLYRTIMIALGLVAGLQAQGTGAVCSYVHSWTITTQDYECVDAPPRHDFTIKFQAHAQRFSQWGQNCPMEAGEHKNQPIEGRGQCGLPSMLGGRTCYPEYWYTLELKIPQPGDPVSAWVHKWQPRVNEKGFLLVCYTTGIVIGAPENFSVWECQDTSLGCPGGGGGGDQ